MSRNIITPESMKVSWSTATIRCVEGVHFAEIDLKLLFKDTEYCLTELPRLSILLRDDAFGGVEAFRLSKEARGHGNYITAAIEDLVHKLYGNNLGELACKI